MDALSLRQHEQLFHELAQCTRSGVTLSQAFELISHHSNDRIATRLRSVRTHLQATGNLGRAFRDAGFSESDAAVIQAGESTGRLDVVFLELGEFYRQLAQARAGIIARSIHPVLVLHAGAVLLAIPPAILKGSWWEFLAQSVPILAGFYLSLILAVILWRFTRRWFSANAAAAAVILRVPLLGHFLCEWTTWKFASVLALHVRAGGSLLGAFEVAAASCDNALLRKATQTAISLVQRGESLGQAFESQPGVPLRLYTLAPAEARPERIVLSILQDEEREFAIGDSGNHWPAWPNAPPGQACSARSCCTGSSIPPSCGPWRSPAAWCMPPPPWARMSSSLLFLAKTSS
jgi:MSHA biogenesis protein MshG